jgi:hypothetical protein
MDLGELCLTIQTQIPIAEPVEGRRIGRYKVGSYFVRVVRAIGWRNAARLFEAGECVARFKSIKSGFGLYEIV